MPELPTPSLPNENTATQTQSITPSPIETGATPASSPLSTPHHGGKRIAIIAGGAIVGIGAIAGLGYAAWAGYLPNPFVKRPTPEAFINALTSMESAKTTIDIHVALEDKEEDVEPLDFSLFQENDEEGGDSSLSALPFTQMLPSDLDLNLSITSSFAKAGEGANEETHITGTYTGNNMSANLDLTTRTVDGTTYLKPDAIPLPIPIFDMSALEGTWINLSGEDEEDRTVFSYAYETEDTEEEVEAVEEETDIKAEVFTILKEGIADGAIIFSVPERVTFNNERAWQTNAVIDGEKLRETIISLGENRETLFPNQTAFELLTDEFIETTEKERAKDVYRELFKRMTLSAIVDNESMPLSLSFTTRIAPKLEDDILEDRQITFETTIDFENINQPVSVSAPEDAITTEEAVALLMGQSEDSTTFDAQYDTVVDIRAALDMYYWETGEYPETLNELIGFKDEYREVIAIPLDAMSGEAYAYERTETGYTITYEMPAGEEDGFSSFFDSTVEGINIATENFLSTEGAKLDDGDEDGLSLYDEVMIYGTSDYVEDSDFDGYSDGAEVESGYNPNGDGPLVIPETTE